MVAAYRSFRPDRRVCCLWLGLVAFHQHFRRADGQCLEWCNQCECNVADDAHTRCASVLVPPRSLTCVDTAYARVGRLASLSCARQQGLVDLTAAQTVEPRHDARPSRPRHQPCHRSRASLHSTTHGDRRVRSVSRGVTVFCMVTAALSTSRGSIGLGRRVGLALRLDWTSMKSPGT